MLKFWRVMKRSSLILSVFLLALIGLSLLLPAVDVKAQEDTTSPEVLELIARMTPEERVGQLFLVSFDGVSVADETQIAALISEYSLGGVILRADKGNFDLESLGELQQLIIGLQREHWDTSRVDRLSPVSGDSYRPEYVPLWVGISLDEEAPAFVNSFDGFSPLPSPMAIGATWDPALAADVGELLGSELAPLGINLYLGPSLDIADHPDPTSSGDLKTNSFGGSAYWVSQMGTSFIRGLNTGSEGKMLIVGTHFPGRGSADRSPSEEMATVRKSFEELKANELAPFAASVDVTNGAGALLVSHIRYEGFQGTIRPTTRPLSLDEKSLSQLLSTSPFAEWRTAGGLTISDDLGSRAIRDFYAPGNQAFYANLVARDAFLAGNDLLYMGDILSSDAPDTYTSITRTLDFFTQKYSEDPAFAVRVDASLARILSQKFRIYPRFTFSAVNKTQNDLAGIGESELATFDVAQRAATLINPNLDDLDATLPNPPGIDDNIIFITDVQETALCSLCGATMSFERTSLRDAVLRLNGRGGAEEVREGNLGTYTFDELESLYVESEEFSMLDALEASDWVVISLASDEKLDTLRQFLLDFQPILRGKKVVLFSFTTPYLLDATDISKFTAYYGLYSYAPPFLDVAARLLFKELTPVGDSPVDITGIGYDIETAIQPDPDQFLSLGLALPLEAAATPQAGSATLAPTSIPMFAVGDTLGVRTGTIYDYNGNPVPDGTRATFTLTMGGEGNVNQQLDAKTISGVARANFQLNQTGLLDIRVSSGNATVSETLRLDISNDGVASAVTIIPPALLANPTSTPEVLPTAIVEESIYVQDGQVRFGAWGIAILLWVFGAGLAYLAGEQIESERWGLRWALSTLLGGLIAYNYLALDLPGSILLTADGLSGVVVFIVLAELLGWLSGWMWYRRSLHG